MAAKARVIVEHAEHQGLFPGPVGEQHGPRALVKVEVPKPMHVRHFVGSRLPRNEARDRVPRATLRTDKTLVFQVAADRCVARQAAETRILTRQHGEVVVVKLVAPARMIAVLTLDRLPQRDRDRGVCAGVLRHLPLERAHRIVVALRQVVPALDRLEGEAHDVSSRRVLPRLLGELGQPCSELAVFGWRMEQRANDRKAQARPSHAHGRVVF